MKNNRFVRIVTACALLAAMMLFMSCAPGIGGNTTPGAPTPATGQPTPKPHNTPAPTAAPELTPAPTPDYYWYLDLYHIEDSFPEDIELANIKPVLTIPLGDGEQEIGYRLDGDYIKTASAFYMSPDGRTLIIYDRANKKFLWFEHGKWIRNIPFQVRPEDLTDDPEAEGKALGIVCFALYHDKLYMTLSNEQYFSHFISINFEGKLAETYDYYDVEHNYHDRMYLDRDGRLRYSCGGRPEFHDYVFSEDGSYYTRTLPAFSRYTREYGDYMPDSDIDTIIEFHDDKLGHQWAISSDEIGGYMFIESSFYVDNNLNLYGRLYGDSGDTQAIVKLDKNGKLIGARCLYEYKKEDGFVDYAGDLIVTEDGRAYMLAVFMDRVELQEILF